MSTSLEVIETECSEAMSVIEVEVESMEGKRKSPELPGRDKGFELIGG